MKHFSKKISFCILMLLLTNDVLAQESPARPYQINFYVYLGETLGAKLPESITYEFSYKIDRIIINGSERDRSVTAFDSFIKTNGYISGEVNAGAELWITVKLKGGGQVLKQETFHMPIPQGSGTYKRKLYFIKGMNYTIADEKNLEYYKNNKP